MQGTKLSCPTCAAKIQINRVLPPGAKGKCPRCGTIFAVPGEDWRPPAPPTMQAAPQRMQPSAEEAPPEDEDQDEDQPRKKKKRRKGPKGGFKSWLALILVTIAVLAFVAYLGWEFYNTAFAPYNQ